jgi:hypothetical protein
MSDSKDWAVRKMVIHLTPEQLLQAILDAANVELNENEVYVRDVSMTDAGDYWEIQIEGAE